MRQPLHSIISVALVATCGLARAQTPQSFAAQVEKGVRATASVLIVEKNPAGKWEQFTYSVEGVTYDVKKTDSALTPLLGVVHASITSFASEEFATEAEARASKRGGPKLSWKVDLSFRPDSRLKRWSFANGTSDMSWSGGDGRSFGGPSPILKSDLNGPGIVEKLASSIGS